MYLHEFFKKFFKLYPNIKLITPVTTKQYSFIVQVSVLFRVVDISATYGADYARTSTDIVLSPRERMKRLPIDINNDALPELDETFRGRMLLLLFGGFFPSHPET